MLFHKISSQFGIVGNMYSALLSPYKNPPSRIVLNDNYTDWFNCPLGLRQGDCISPTLFSIFINDLATELNQTNVGISLDSSVNCAPAPAQPPVTSPATASAPPTLINSLLYADDLVLIANNEHDLQFLINIVNLWCVKWRLDCNLSKTSILHVMKANTACSKHVFKLGQNVIGYCKTYKYLGITINQFLNFEQIAKAQTDPASRALSAVLTKMIKNGGFPHKIYEMLYTSCVTSICDYGHEVFGFHQYPASEKLHSKALRFYLGTGKTAPLCGLRSELSWPEPRSRTQTRMLRYYFHLRDMENNRLTKKVFLYDQQFAISNQNLSCWTSEINQILIRNNLLLVSRSFKPKLLVSMLQDSLLQKDNIKFKQDCSQSSMLRSYNTLFSPFIDHSCSTKYVTLNLPFIIRKRLCQLRLGCLPLKIQTDRYIKPRIPPEERFCCQPRCISSSTGNRPVEDEMHFLLICEQYKSLRESLYSKIDLPGFMNMPDSDKCRHLLTSGPNCWTVHCRCL
jgi:hypothetical protein